MPITLVERYLHLSCIFIHINILISCIYSAIQLFAERKAVDEGLVSTGNDTLLITNEIVKLAVDEHNQNPMLIGLRNACLLDQCIVIAAYR